MIKRILVLNAGSSSIKFALFEAGKHAHLQQAQLQGIISGLGTTPAFSARDPAGNALSGHLPAGANTHESALAWLFDWLREHQDGQLIGAGHRVVHGGEHFCEPVLIDAEALAALERLVPLAPLHQPHNLAAIRAHQTTINGAASRVSVYVIPANEEAVIARSTAALLRLRVKSGESRVECKCPREKARLSTLNSQR